MTILAKKKKGTRHAATPAALGDKLTFSSNEAFNLLRTNVIFAFSESERGRVIGVTSANTHDGKTYNSINLAYSLASAGYKTVLIDADLRLGSVARYLEQKSSPGLSNYLVGDSQNVVHVGLLHKNLNVVMMGDTPPNPTALFSSEMMEHMLEAFRKRYDYIVMDLPPVNTVADPLIVSKKLDGIVLVVRHESTTRSDVFEAVRQLRLADANVIGFVYNGFRVGSRYGYRYRSGGRYYSSHYYRSHHSARPDEDHPGDGSLGSVE